jgi:hypothetical protein
LGAVSILKMVFFCFSKFQFLAVLLNLDQSRKSIPLCSGRKSGKTRMLLTKLSSTLSSLAEMADYCVMIIKPIDHNN